MNHPKNPIRAVICGYYGFQNLGDDAILLALSRQLSRTQPPVELTVLSGCVENTRQHYGLDAVPRFSPGAVLGALRRSDALIVGGGSLLQDRTSSRSLLYYLAVIWMAKILKKPVYLCANGIGPVEKSQNRQLLKQTLRHCDAITLRDPDSLALVEQLGVTRPEPKLVSDPVFWLTPDDSGPRHLVAAGVPAGKKMLGISLRDVPGGEGLPGEFARLCDRLSRVHDLAIVFLVMQEAADTPISQQVQQQMEEPSWLVKTPDDPRAMLSVVQQMDAVVAMRLHTIIFAGSVNVPVAGCVYDPKVSAFLDLLDMPACGTSRNFSAENAYPVVEAMLAHLPEYRERLARRAAPLIAHSDDAARALQDIF